MEKIIFTDFGHRAAVCLLSNRPGYSGWLILLVVSSIFSLSVSAQVSGDELPDNASAKRYASGWECDHGFRAVEGSCVAVDVPVNAYATASSYGRGWECKRGYRRSDQSCSEIDLPANAYLNSSRGDTWKCRRGFREEAGKCMAIQVPSNGYLSASSYGSGWKCERGYEAVAGACALVQLPDNAHLDFSGNDWDCDPPYLKRMAGCVSR